MVKRIGERRDVRLLDCCKRIAVGIVSFGPTVITLARGEKLDLGGRAHWSQPRSLDRTAFILS